VYIVYNNKTGGTIKGGIKKKSLPNGDELGTVAENGQTAKLHRFS